jgi:hypothetical protein
LLGVLLVAPAAAGIGLAALLYRREGVVFYPSLALVNYSLRGVPAQVPALAAAALGFLAIWAGTRGRSRAWLAIGALLLAVSVAGLVSARSPYRPVAGATIGAQVYQLASFRADERTPELFILFTCEPTGTICHEVGAFAPFDVASGRYVAGVPELVTDSTTRTVTLQVDGYVIGVYRPGTR